MKVFAHATLRYLRMSDKKVRLLVDLIRGMRVDRALSQLTVSPKIARTPLTKLVKSAVANAVHNLHAQESSLIISEMRVDKAPMLYRHMPRARGSAAPIRKHFCHVKVVLAGEAVETPHA